MIRKFPRTPHLEGSRHQAGDDLADIAWSNLAGRPLVVAEKIDGANAGISFSPDGDLRLQSRGHFLTGGARERHFGLFKTWASTHVDALFDILGSRYIAYGEWLYAKHTVFYDALPHYFLEFDVYDREEDVFLSTPRRRRLWEGGPVSSVPVLHEGSLANAAALAALTGPSRFKSPEWRSALEAAAATKESAEWGSVERAVAETDPSDLAEGLYLKVEEDDVVTHRLKWVRPSFAQAIQEAGGHWLSKPIVPNGLAPGVSLW